MRGRSTSLVTTTAGFVAGGVSAGASATTASKLTMGCGRPSSSITKSSRVRPGTGTPLSSTTTTSTVTSSTLVGKVGGGWAGAAVAAPRAQARETHDARADFTHVLYRRPYDGLMADDLDPVFRTCFIAQRIVPSTETRQRVG